MIQKDPEEYQTENFKFKLDFEIKHNNSEFWESNIRVLNSFSAPDYVVLNHIPSEEKQPTGFFGGLSRAWKALVTTFNGQYEFDGYINCAPYFKQGRLLTKNMFIWYDTRGFWMIGNNQHFASQNGKANLRLYTKGM